MFRNAFRSLSPLRLERPPPRPLGEGASYAPDVAAGDQSATQLGMAVLGHNERALVDALDEPALVVEAEHRSPRQRAGAKAARQPASKAATYGSRSATRRRSSSSLRTGSGEIDVTGIVEPGRSWRLIIRHLWPGAALVRMIDRSDAVSAEKMRVDFVANASHELRTPLSTVLGYAETLAEESDLPDRAALELRPHHPRRGAPHAADHRGFDEPVADRGRPLRRARTSGSTRRDCRRLRSPMPANGAAAAGASSRYRSPADLPPVRGDRAQLIQVLDNLIGNAVRYGCDRPGCTDRHQRGALSGRVGCNSP